MIIRHARFIGSVALLVAASCHSDGPGDAGSPSDAGPAPDGGPVEVLPKPDAGTIDPPVSTERTWPPARPGYVNPIPGENAKAGDPQWSRFQKKARAGEIEGYSDRVTAAAGDTVGIHASCDTASEATWQLYRLGWYGGAGARRVTEGRFSCALQPRCPQDAATGRVQCAWPAAFPLPLDAATVSGLHVVKLVRDDGFSAWVPLVVRDDRPADLLFQASTTTWQAYNDWGGASTYRDPSGTQRRGRAVEVSFDRPYTEGLGSGQLLLFEEHFARFLEQHGYDVAYTDNTWVSAADAAGLATRGAFLSVGHDEYWTGSERDVVTAARDLGMPLLFFSANSAYWQVRLDDDRGSGTRRLTCYKEWSAEDPVQGPARTAKFRQVGRPENGLLGVMFDGWHHLRFPLLVADPGHFLFRGTGLRAGDELPWVIGYETDRRFDNGAEPAGVTVAARVPIVDVEGRTMVAETTSYRAASGALVFATGTIEWALGLAPGPIFDPRLERLTANVLEEALGLEVPATVGTAPGPARRLTGPFAAVRTVAEGVGTPLAVAVLPDGALAVADQQTHRILRVQDGHVSALAGSTQGRGGWDGTVTVAAAQFDRPAGLLVDPDGNLIVADTANHCLRRVRVAEGQVETIAGACGTPAFADGRGTAARFTYPMGLAWDATRAEIVVADAWNHAVRTVAFGTWETRTLAGGNGNGHVDGPASSARLSYPTAVAADAAGRVSFASSGTFSLGLIDGDAARTVTTLTQGTPGTSDGDGTTAGLGPQAGLGWRDGALVVSDAANGRLRRVVPGHDAATTVVTTLAGGGRRIGADGAGDVASFLLPLGLTVAADGTVFVADAARGRVLAVGP